MENYLSSLETPPPSKPVRPTFLTVLCILTFIGSGLGIIQDIISYMNANTNADIAQTVLQDAQDKLSEAEDSGTGAKIAEKIFSGTSDMLVPANMRKIALFSIVASIFTLLGGILMFQLKKTGFWIYVLGTIVGIVGPITIFGTGNLLSVFQTMGIAFIGVIFVVLYALNLKHLK